MSTKRYLPGFAAASLALLMSSGVAGAAPPATVGLIAFSPVTIPDSGGAALEQAVLTLGETSYEVTFSGLGVGGAKGVAVTVTGEVYGLSNPNALEGVYVTELASAPPTEVSSDDLWLDSARGVSLLLHTDTSAAAIAAGSDTVLVQFGWAE
ncbi:MAG: hypothetical protein KFB96_11320 [Thiocapsa sp.]|uniref:hypothetical protein n=1 Tax=Thiocapsa sp. TaxID=2024551 RepID=UPI001BD1B5FE|nr:hypothetical protein [Thiocapsa sp.]QVL50932.1 MAG: hypothetical protein KFB96_11320 [Thiocapsa sp.]